MIYKDFHELKLSALGLGCMRFPVFDGDAGKVDEKAAEELVDYAIAHGINYFDTAWSYHGGHSEELMGRLLSKYPRESYYLATKFPGHEAGNMHRVEEIFQTQLKRCGVEYFDFYLFHNVNESNIDAYLDDKTYGVYSYLMEQKRLGRIRHLGFSTHGTIPTMRRFLQAYGKSMEFCQIQLNFFDWSFQDAKGKVDLLREYGLPIWVMEPLRGGKLVKMMEEEGAQLKSLRPDEEIPGWGFRFLQGIEGVTVVLSGMSNERQFRENIRTFSDEKNLNEVEYDALMQVNDRIRERTVVACTGCGYCTVHCPRKLDIPHLLNLYSEHVVSLGGFYAPMVLRLMPEEKKPWACVGCRVCESVCPQNIKISEILSEFSQKVKR